MSLTVKYTAQGTAIVTCGDLTVEIPLAPKASLIGQTLRVNPVPQKNPPAPSPAANPARSSDPPPKKWPAPKDPPGVMIAPRAGLSHFSIQDLLSKKAHQLEHVYLPIGSLPSSRGALTAKSRGVILKNAPGRRPRIKILHVGVPAKRLKAGIDVTKFEGLFKDKGLGLDAVHLVSAKPKTHR